MSGESNERGETGVLAAVPAGSMRGRPTSIEERRRLVAESLQVGNPLNRSKDLPEQADPRHDCQIELKVEEIRPYEHNPRRANNAKFGEIKESIRSTGIRNPLTVTRRPGEQHFIVEAGGNTRLLAIQQLWAETRDPRFEKLTVLFRPWRSEGHVLVAHLIENEQRGELTFWDKANGVVALKAQFEEEKGRALSLRQLEDELKAVGFAVNTATLTHYLYATARLRVLGDAIPILSGLDVKLIQPRLNHLKRYAQTRREMGEAALYEAVFEPEFRRHADRYRETGTFNALDLCRACEEALAGHLGEDLGQFRMVLDSLAHEASEGGSGVSSANTQPLPTAAQKLPRASAQAPRLAQIDPPVLDQLKASIGRFAQLAVQPFEARAWSMLGLISTQVEENVRALLPEAPGFRDGAAALIALDAEFFDWLLDGRNEAATAFWEIATLVRKCRANYEHSHSAGSE